VNVIQSLRSSSERYLPWLVLAFLLVFTYATFFQVPYVGFDFNPTNGELLDVFIASPQGAGLQPGDFIQRIGDISWDEIMASTRQPIFEGVAAGDLLPLDILREGQEISLLWRIPGPNSQELTARIVNLWFLAYVFWLAGTAALLFLRPKDTRWKLFIAFFYLTAAWLITGNISRYRIWETAVLFRSLIWLSLPVYLHFHWTFPKPFGRIPRPLIVSGYLLAATLTLAEWFYLLPLTAYGLGFLPTAVSCAVLLILHFTLQPAHRREAGLMGLAILLSFVPLSGISIALLIDEIPAYGSLGILGLPALPLIYFYVVSWHRLGGLELRANRLITLYLFFILVGTIFIVLVTAANTWLDYPGSETTNGILAALLAGIITSIGYPPFKGFVERYLLGMPLPPEHLLQIYTTRITTSLDLSTLVDLFRIEVLPSLLIRQSALMRMDDAGQIETLFSMGVDEALSVSNDDLSQLLELGESPGLNSYGNEPIQGLPWVRLVLPLKLGERRIGFWLLGRRAPDDFYAQSEILILQTLANETAIALTNIAQSEQLRTIYQSNIDRYEQERSKLARDLHDDLNNQLILLGLYAEPQTATPGFTKAYRELVDHIRHTINGLRPPILDFGLLAALEDMIEELSDQPNQNVTIDFLMPASEQRYPSQVEENLFRIVQQATDNALRYSRGKHIRINGRLEPEAIDLEVEDDGVGFDATEKSNLTRLQADGHLGIVGMLERASLIGATVEIHSIPGSGTRFSIAWKTSGKV
jgi:signal transduction histidine kinase